MCKNIAVFFGGVSSENEISVITGTMVCNVLKKGGCRVYPVYITQDGRYFSGGALFNIKNFAAGKIPSAAPVAFGKNELYILSKRGKIKERVALYCAVNCCHGGWGEGGGISGLCAAMSVPLASAGPAESSVFIDKYLTKIMMKGLGVDTVEYVYLNDISGATQISNFPVMVKPARLGSSIGVVKAQDSAELKAALETAFTLDGGAIVERYVSNRREVNCAAYFLGGDVVCSPCEEVFGGDILSYDDKYSGNGKRVCPADLPEHTSDRIRGITEKVYSSLGMRGIVRFDFILEGQKIYLSEINTVPGSLSQYLISQNYDAFYKLLLSLIEQARADFAVSSSKLLINTGIINNFASNACKIK